MTHSPGIRRRRRATAASALLLAASLTAAGCSSGSGQDSAAGAGSKAVAPAGAPGGSGAKDDSPGARGSGSGPGGTPATGAVTPAPATYLVRTAELTVRTPHVADALAKARELAAAAGGYAGDEDTTVEARGHTQSSIQLRVPTAGYDRLLTGLAALGTLIGRTVNVEDVTGEVVDVGSRIKSQQASVARVRALMERADRLGDVVALEGELSTRQAALEALQAQQASLKSRTDLATVTLRLTEPPVRAAAPEPDRDDGFWGTVGDALGDGWKAFSTTVRTMLVVLSVTLPFLVAALLIWSVARSARRRLPRRSVTAPPPPFVPASLRAPATAPAAPGEEPEPSES
jgi:hypothetical protein